MKKYTITGTTSATKMVRNTKENREGVSSLVTPFVFFLSAGLLKKLQMNLNFQ